MSGIAVKRRDGEASNSLIYRFTKRIQQSGVLREARKRRFSHRRVTKNKRHISAIYKTKKTAKILSDRKLGLL